MLISTIFSGVMHLGAAYILTVCVGMTLSMLEQNIENKIKNNYVEDVKRRTGLTYEQFSDDRNSDAIETIINDASHFYREGIWQNTLSDLFGLFSKASLLIIFMSSYVLPAVLVYVERDPRYFWAMPIGLAVSFGAAGFCGYLCFLLTNRTPGAARSFRAYKNVLEEERQSSDESLAAAALRRQLLNPYYDL